MIFCQLAQARSLRKISEDLRCCEGKLKHLGLEQEPKRSTLSCATAHRPWELFEKLFYVEDKQEDLGLQTNNFKLAAIDKVRWQIELFFKLLKQQLKIKAFVGTSANAVRIQIWAAVDGDSCGGQQLHFPILVSWLRLDPHVE